MLLVDLEKHQTRIVELEMQIDAMKEQAVIWERNRQEERRDWLRLTEQLASTSSLQGRNTSWNQLIPQATGMMHAPLVHDVVRCPVVHEMSFTPFDIFPAPNNNMTDIQAHITGERFECFQTCLQLTSYHL